MMFDYYYYEYPKWESPYAVNYNVEQRNWFVSHGIKLHYVTAEQIIQLGKIPVWDNNDRDDWEK